MLQLSKCYGDSVTKVCSRCTLSVYR